MEQDDSKLQEQGLVYEGMTDLAWESRSEDKQGSAMGTETNRNERLLRVLSLFDEQIPERSEDETEAMSELLRIETKLDLVLELLSSLVASNEKKLRRLPIRLGAYGIEWEEESIAPADGELLWLQFKLDLRLPQPLCLPARVVDVQAQPGKHTVRAEFEFQGAELPELLEKFIFRQHRRQIARMRAAKPEQRS